MISVDEFQMIDAHCHVYKPWVKKPIEVLSRAKEKGLSFVVSSSDMPEEFPRIMALQKHFPDFLHATYGFGPSRVGQLDHDEAFQDAERHLEDYIALGEIGLDYHWVKEDSLRKLQRKIFIQWLEFANEHDKPVVIHSRKAEMHCVDILIRHADVPVMMHSFAANPELATKAWNEGFFISIPTSVVERKVYRRIVRTLPLEAFIVETDAPWMSPVKGQKNEPMYVKFAINEIAKLKDVDPHDVEKSTDKNARSFYRL